MLNEAIGRVEAAIRELKAGKMVILTDNPDRENEGDLIIAAEKITAETMNFMIRNGTGIVCLPLTEEQLTQLQIPLMVEPRANTCLRGTQFTVSIDAKEGITTGVCAADRAMTVLTVMKDNAMPNDIVKPGHIFPLLAKKGGVLERQGHTEGSIDLAKLAGFKPAAVLCEIMNPDGSMTRGQELIDFSKKHQLLMLSINDIIAYRLSHESLVADEATANLPLEKYGTFKITVVKEKLTGHDHLILEKPSVNPQKPVLVRIHSSCMTSDIFASKRCDCHSQLHYALDRISQEGGMLVYLNQEGRGIGIFNKIKAYALQEQGYDTIDANTQLGLPADSRNYALAADILRARHISQVRLLTNNPSKLNELQEYGIHVTHEPMPTFHTQDNQTYLKTKKEKLKHFLQLNIHDKGKTNET